MSKLSMDALRERAEAVASTELLNAISGGTESACHDDPQQTIENAASATTSKGIYEALKDLE